MPPLDPRVAAYLALALAAEQFPCAGGPHDKPFGRHRRERGEEAPRYPVARSRRRNAKGEWEEVGCI